MGKKVVICFLLSYAILGANGSWRNFIHWKFNSALPKANVESQENQEQSCDTAECKLQQQSCLDQCQKKQMNSLGFCSTFGSTYAPFVEHYATFYQEYDSRYFTNAVIGALEGVFIAIANICESELAKICHLCGEGIEFQDVLKSQNMTLEALKENDGKVELILEEINNLTTATFDLQLTDYQLYKNQRYDQLLYETEQILYWFTLKDKSRLFQRLLQQKIQGIQGGLEWITWALDDMVRDLISSDKDTFCPLIPFYLNLQLRVAQVSAYLAAQDGHLLELDQIGSNVILGKNYTQILEEQRMFIGKHCISSMKPATESDFMTQ